MALKQSRKRSGRTRGMAMVEMVFVLPVLVLIVFAIAQFGLMFSRWLTLSNAVREGARAAVAYRTPCSAASVQTSAVNTVKNYAKAGGIPPTSVDVTFPGSTFCASGSTLTVLATYDFELNMPFFNYGTLPLAYKSTMRNE